MLIKLTWGRLTNKPAGLETEGCVFLSFQPSQPSKSPVAEVYNIHTRNTWLTAMSTVPLLHVFKCQTHHYTSLCVKIKVDIVYNKGSHAVALCHYMW